MRHEVAVAPVAAGGAARLSILGEEAPPMGERQQGVEMRIRHEDDIATAPAVAAVRTTLGHELLATETAATVAALARPHGDLCVIDEHAEIPSSPR